MREMAAGKFKAQCLAVMDEVAKTRETVTITKRGHPVARLVPVEDKPVDLFNRLKGQIEITGDLVEPSWPYEDYESLR